METMNEPNNYINCEREALKKCLIKNIKNYEFPNHSKVQLGIINNIWYELWNNNIHVGNVSITTFLSKRVIIYSWFTKGLLDHSLEYYFVEKLKGE